MEKNIAVIKGDGIGPEVVSETMKVLDAVGQKYNHQFHYTQILMGGCSIDAYGEPLTDEALAIAKSSDAVLLGSIGGNTSTSPWYKLPPDKRPEAGLLKIRKELGLFANLRPAYLYPELADACPLKEATSAKGFDMIIVRELTGGLYFGERSTKEVNGELVAHDNLIYSESEIRRIAIKAFEKPVILLMGGHEKGLPLDDVRALNDHIKYLVTFGEAGHRFACDMHHPHTYEVSHMKDAILKANELATSGDVILLSPSTSSFDEFNNMGERGRKFKEIVKQL